MGSDDEDTHSTTPVALSRITRQAARNLCFRDLVTYLDKNTPLSINTFNELIRSYNSTVNVNVNTDPEHNYSSYPLIRYLLPALDQRKCRLKPASAKRLLSSFIHVPIPANLNTAQDFATYIASTAPSVSLGMSLDDLNKELDIFAHERPRRAAVIQHLCRQMDAREMLWIFRFFFHEISEYLGGRGGSTTIINYLAPNAKELWLAGMSLYSISTAASQASQTGTSLDEEVILNKCVRPMLLARINCNTAGIMKLIQYCGRPFYVETKYDGEHFLLHRSEYGEKYLYFTRKGADYTDELGMDAHTGFTARLHTHFRADVKDCVLDGELVVYDKENKRIVGKNRRTDSGLVYDVKHLEDNARFQRAFVVFDVLLLNGECYTTRPLHKRLESLRSEIFANYDPATLLISQQIEISKVDGIRQYYSEHLKRGEEGIVVKGRNSQYHFGQRAANNGWFKIKPDYGARLTLDLAVVGAHYGENPDKPRSYLIAARLNNGRLRVIRKVNGNLRKDDYELLIKSLKLDKNSSTTRPEWVEGGTTYTSVKYVQRENVQVVEVKASGLINRKLQFPAITAIRPDKFVDEINAYNDVIDYEVKLRERKRLQPDDLFLLNPVKRLRYAVDTRVAQSPQRDEASTCLSGVVVWAIDDTPKLSALRKCKEKLARLGVKLVENHCKDIKFAVSLNPKGLKTSALAGRDVVNIVSCAWVDRCFAEGHLCPWYPDEIFYRCQGAEIDLSDLAEFEQVPVEMPVNSAVDTTRRTSRLISPSPAAEIGSRLEGVGFNADAQDDNEDMQALFTNLIFHAPGYTTEALSPEYVKKLTSNGATIVDELQDDITHLFFEIKYDFDTDPLKLSHWLDDHEWTCVLTDCSWVDDAIKECTRYIDSLRIPELKTY